MRETVIRRMVFTFNQAAAGGAATIPLANCIDTSKCVSGSMYLRLHAKDWVTGTGNFDVDAYNVAYTPDEPDVVYIDRSADVARIQVGTADVSPKLYVEALAAPIGDQIQIVLEWTHGSDTTTKTFAISVELELRDS